MNRTISQSFVKSFYNNYLQFGRIFCPCTVSNGRILISSRRGIKHFSKDMPLKHRQNKSFKYFLLAIPPVTFGLGCWQIQRLQWKTDLIGEMSTRISEDPIILPENIESDIQLQKDLEYRRVLLKGRFCHDQEITVGPRTLNGKNGFWVISPMVLKSGKKILVNRGWIPHDQQDRAQRPKISFSDDEVVIEGMLRQKMEPSWTSLKNSPEKGDFYVVDIDQFAALTQSKPILIDLIKRDDEPINFYLPIPKPANLNLRNHHMEYVVTWFGISIASAIMCIVLFRRPQTAAKVRLKAASI